MSKQPTQRPSRWPTMPRWFGVAWLTVAAITAAVFNSWAEADPTPGNTISAAVTLVRRFFLVASALFSAGLLGHWCSRGLDLPILHPWGVKPFLAFVLLAGLLDLALRGWIAHHYPFAVLATVGLPAGLILWAMPQVAA